MTQVMIDLYCFCLNRPVLTFFHHKGFDMSGSWGCPREIKGLCSKVKDLPCDPGMKGCVLYGRFAFSVDEKNSPAVKRKLKDKKTEKGQ